MMKTDVIIVGGGLIGAATALQLAMRGIRSLVLDKESPGRHASGANAGGLRSLNRDPAEIPLSIEATKMWHNMPNLVDSDCDARFPGGMRVAENTEDMDKLAERASQVQNLGYDHEVLIDKKELYKLVPALKPGCVGALLCRTDGYGRPYHALTAFRLKAESLGARFISRAEVFRVQALDDGFEVRTSNGCFNSDILVNCAGAWGNRLAEQLGENIPLTPKALMLMVTERLPHFIDPVLGAASRKLSFKQMQNGTVIIGGALVAKLDFSREQTEINWDQMARSAQTVLDFFPQLQHTRIVRAWAGIEGFTPDNLPVIDASKTQPNAYHAFGFSAHGFQLSPVIGKIMAELIVDGKSSLPIAPFAIDRFKAEPTDR